MSEKYNPKTVEKKWQTYWQENKIFESHINKEKETRISLNVRFKNLFSPTGLKNQLQYYRPLNISNITKFGAQIDSKEKF